MPEPAPVTNLQPTLSDALFPPVRRADVPTVKVAIAGTVELTQEEYQAYLGGRLLGPGAVVEIRAAGYVVQPGAAWVSRKVKTEGRYNHDKKDFEGGATETQWFRQGRIKVRLTDLGELSPTGEEFSGE